MTRDDRLSIYFLGIVYFFPIIGNTNYRITRDCVHNFDFKTTLEQRCSYRQKCRLNLHLRESFWLFSKKKKKKCLPTYSNFEFEKRRTK